MRRGQVGGLVEGDDGDRERRHAGECRANGAKNKGDGRGRGRPLRFRSMRAACCGCRVGAAAAGGIRRCARGADVRGLAEAVLTAAADDVKPLAAAERARPARSRSPPATACNRGRRAARCCAPAPGRAGPGTRGSSWTSRRRTSSPPPPAGARRGRATRAWRPRACCSPSAGGRRRAPAWRPAAPGCAGSCCDCRVSSRVRASEASAVLCPIG